MKINVDFIIYFWWFWLVQINIIRIPYDYLNMHVFHKNVIDFVWIFLNFKYRRSKYVWTNVNHRFNSLKLWMSKFTCKYKLSNQMYMIKQLKSMIKHFCNRKKVLFTFAVDVPLTDRHFKIKYLIKMSKIMSKLELHMQFWATVHLLIHMTI